MACQDLPQNPQTPAPPLVQVCQTQIALHIICGPSMFEYICTLLYGGTLVHAQKQILDLAATGSWQSERGRHARKRSVCRARKVINGCCKLCPVKEHIQLWQGQVPLQKTQRLAFGFEECFALHVLPERVHVFVDQHAG